MANPANDRMMQRKARKSDHRISSRADVSIAASVREPGFGKTDAMIMDLSLSGFRMRCMTRLNQEKTLYMTLPGFNALECKICWHEGDLYGCEFNNALYPAVFDHIISKYPMLKKAS